MNFYTCIKLTMDYNHKLGLFPLRVFLLPGEQTTLHIYEHKYLQLIKECYLENEVFGIPFQGKTTLSEFGSVVKITQILKKYNDGSRDILIECVYNFKINNFEAKKDDKLYPSGKVSILEDVNFKPNNTLIIKVSSYLQVLLDKDVTLEKNELLSPKSIINIMNLNDNEKLKFISYTNERKNEFFHEKIKFMQILLNQEIKAEQNYYLN